MIQQRGVSVVDKRIEVLFEMETLQDLKHNVLDGGLDLHAARGFDAAFATLF